MHTKVKSENCCSVRIEEEISSDGYVISPAPSSGRTCFPFDKLANNVSFDATSSNDNEAQEDCLPIVESVWSIPVQCKNVDQESKGHMFSGMKDVERQTLPCQDETSLSPGLKLEKNTQLSYERRFSKSTPVFVYEEHLSPQNSLAQHIVDDRFYSNPPSPSSGSLYRMKGYSKVLERNDQFRPSRKRYSEEVENARKQRKRRVTFTREQRAFLEHEFEKRKYPSRGTLEHIARSIDADHRTVQVWFQNARRLLKEKLMRGVECPNLTAVLQNRSSFHHERREEERQQNGGRYDSGVENESKCHNFMLCSCDQCTEYTSLRTHSGQQLISAGEPAEVSPDMQGPITSENQAVYILDEDYGTPNSDFACASDRSDINYKICTPKETVVLTC